MALATDYNPGSSPTISMPMVLSLACTQMRMTVEEALTAATINGAYALELGERKGSVEAGKDADLAFFELDDYRELPYWFGGNSLRGGDDGGAIRGYVLSSRRRCDYPQCASLRTLLAGCYNRDSFQQAMYASESPFRKHY